MLGKGFDACVGGVHGRQLEREVSRSIDLEHPRTGAHEPQLIGGNTLCTSVLGRNVFYGVD